MMTAKDIIYLAGNLGVPAVLLLVLIWRGFPLLDKIIQTLQSRNGDIRDLVFAVRDLVEHLKNRG